MIDLNNITVRIGAKVLLESSSAHIADGWKVGLVGANGCGKSTLFKVLQGELETEGGDVFFPADRRVAFVAQEQSDIDLGLLDFVLARDVERAELMQKLETAAVEELSEIHERLNMIEASSAEARAAAILTGLGFTEADLLRPIKEFSGGWRMRVALAAALFQPSEILLLDEPTNHLDLEAGIWLENHLRAYRGTLLLISHDRRILNDLCDHIIHFEGQKLNSYSGNYDIFCRTRTLQREVQTRQIARQDVQRRHLQSFVDRFRYKASKAKQAQSRIKMLEKMETLAPLSEEYSTSFDFPMPENLAAPLVKLEDVSTGYGDKMILQKLNLQIGNDDRIALLGANGNGKSTFAKLLSERLPAMEGNVHRSRKLEVGYFAQHQAEELPMDATPTEFMSRLMPNVLEPKLRSHLARFGLGKEKALTVIEKLSGGEKARLLFAAMTVKAPALLILDEPTNHLDIDGRDALIEALNAYNGSVILITHDLHLIELLADELWLVKNHTCKIYDGDLDDYRKELLSGKSFTRKSPAEKKQAPTAAKPTPTLSYQEQKELSTLLRRAEKEVATLHDKKAAMSARFLENLPAGELVSLQRDYAYLEKQLNDAEENWLELSTKLEAK